MRDLKAHKRVAKQARVIRRQGGGLRGASGRVVVTKAGLEQVRKDAAQGLSNATIAARLGIDRHTLLDVRRRQCEVEEALQRGRGKLEDSLTESLLSAALSGNVVAAIWLTKARLGWHETGPRDGGARVNVQINLPAAMTEKDYRRVIDVAATPVEEGTHGE